jgi:hypothetical protein
MFDCDTGIVNSPRKQSEKLASGEIMIFGSGDLEMELRKVQLIIIIRSKYLGCCNCCSIFKVRVSLQ